MQRLALGLFGRATARECEIYMTKMLPKAPQKPRIGDGVPTYSVEEANKILTPAERAYAESLERRGDIEIPTPTRKNT